ncbi:MAG: pilus assembly protein [Desulfovibrio sp.]|uniref:pilus assembly protein n=1 Tax=Desulfovibrio sp. TaxID=885 RepID=UPI0025B87B7B|nr:pilus assembly protein [Desulfovibrio sp.]MCI7568959.1 pilus assembly protein [Desulfovibrio sp.]
MKVFLLKQRVVAALIITALSFGCAHSGAPKKDAIEAKGKDFSALARSRAVEVSADSYVGAHVVPLREADERSEAALAVNVTLRQRGTLGQIVSTLTELTPVAVRIGTEPAPLKGGERKPVAQTPEDLELPLLLPSAGPLQTVDVSYEGTLRGLLDHIAVSSGYGWDYDAASNTVTFTRFMVRTFTLLSAPGRVEYDSQITNKSRESSNSGIGGSGVNATVVTADTSSQTAQSNTVNYRFDVWTDTEKVVKALLSSEGAVVGNQAAGTLTVRDFAENVRQIGRYIAETNRRLSRQVAVSVNVWALEVTDENEAGLNLQGIFTNSDVSVIAGNLANMGGSNTASATVVSGRLKDSGGVLKALKQWGDAVQVTSGGGLVMSNQPVPIQAIQRTAYLAGSSASQSDYGQTTELTPGEVTTGFTATIIPHILDRRRVILQYNLNLSTLDELTEFSTSDLTIQLPKTSTRAFSQRSQMQMGQTLVLAGFQDETQSLAKSLGLFNMGRSAGYSKTLLVVTISVEAAGGGTED